MRVHPLPANLIQADLYSAQAAERAAAAQKALEIRNQLLDKRPRLEQRDDTFEYAMSEGEVGRDAQRRRQPKPAQNAIVPQAEDADDEPKSFWA